ncbi:MAG: membrane protein insertase YidC [Holosporales bacterium]|jgi:YidC/Oxa1 family membrane protein insertase|nr:membrane protein insertase YidC [Holosporales bacterium]
MSEQNGMIFAIAISFLILIGFHYFTDVEQTAEVTPNTPQYVNNIKSENTEGQKLPRSEALKQSERIFIQTPKLSGSINLVGAVIDDLSLIDYKETTEKNSSNVNLLNPANTENPYYISITWQKVADNHKFDLPNEQTKWSIFGEQKNVLSSEIPVKLVWANPQGIIFERTISIDNIYMISSVDRIINNSGKDLRITQHCEIVRIPGQQGRFAASVYEGGIGYFDNTLKEISFEKLGKGNVVGESVSNGWAGFTDKYWFTSFIIKEAVPVKINFEQESELVKCKMDTTEITVKAGENFEYKNLIFSGAKVLNCLESYEKTHGIKKFELAVDFGWFYFLTKPLFYLLQFFNSLLGSVALAIIILTILSKILLFPFARKSQISMTKMKDLQPKMEALKQKYGNDKVKMNEELLKLYKKDKINPASGCLPLLVQMPIFFCLYKVFSISIEMRHAPLIFWIKDLSAPDPSSIFNLLGLIPWTPPAFLQIGLLPILMGITMFLQQKLSPQPTDSSQAKIMYLMPLIFLFMFATFPSGLVLYWTISNILAILQQLLIKPENKLSKAKT